MISFFLYNQPSTLYYYQRASNKCMGYIGGLGGLGLGVAISSLPPPWDTPSLNVTIVASGIRTLTLAILSLCLFLVQCKQHLKINHKSKASMVASIIDFLQILSIYPILECHPDNQVNIIKGIVLTCPIMQSILFLYCPLDQQQYSRSSFLIPPYVEDPVPLSYCLSSTYIVGPIPLIILHHACRDLPYMITVNPLVPLVNLQYAKLLILFPFFPFCIMQSIVFYL